MSITKFTSVDISSAHKFIDCKPCRWIITNNTITEIFKENDKNCNISSYTIFFSIYLYLEPFVLILPHHHHHIIVGTMVKLHQVYARCTHKYASNTNILILIQKDKKVFFSKMEAEIYNLVLSQYSKRACKMFHEEQPTILITSQEVQNLNAYKLKAIPE